MADAEFVDPPIIDGHLWQAEANHPSRMTWPRNGRLFAFGEGGYLPVLDVTKAIIEGLDYKGWISLELFSRSMAVPGPNLLQAHTRKGRESWDRLKKELSLDA
jgi:4-hydroxyphenylpyruvate dioxygenase